MLKNKISQMPTTTNAVHRARRLYLQTISNATEEYDTTAHLAYQYRGDFYGLLKEINVDPRVNLLTLELNNLDSSITYTGYTRITLINPNILAKLLKIVDRV